MNRVLAIMVLALVVSHAVAAELGDRPSDWRGTPDDYEGQWEELNADELPAAPLDENLRALFSADLDDQYSYRVDRESVAVFADKTFRYTIVIESPSGVRNVFYEGLRCETREFKSFAYLARNGFRLASNAQWEPLKRTGLTIYRRILLDDYVCPRSKFPKPRDYVVAKLDEGDAQLKRAVWSRLPERDSGPSSSD